MSLSDDLIKHQIFIQRLAGTEYKSIKKDLKRLGEIAKGQAEFGATNTKQILRQSVSEFANRAIEDLSKFAEYEAQFSKRVFEKHIKEKLTAPKKESILNALETKNIEINNNIRGGTRKSLKTAYSQFARRKADELAQIIKDGHIQGLSSKQIQKNISKHINTLQNAQARALAKTSINYTASVAKDATIKANRQIFNKVIWVSVLDSGTTDYCQDHDGNIYNIDEGPRPPAHWGCRSHIEPYVDD